MWGCMREIFLTTVLAACTIAAVTNVAYGDNFARRAPYACDSDICDPTRQAYVRQSEMRACASHRVLERLMTQLGRKKADYADADRRYGFCLLRHRVFPFRCAPLARRVMGLRIAVARLEARVDAQVRRLQNECARSFPGPGRRRVPSQCEQNEASNYCPVNSAAEALAALQRRCNDLRIESGMVPLNCNPVPCQDPGRVALVMEGRPAIAALMAQLPTCPGVSAPTLAATPTAPPSPTLSATPPTVTAESESATDETGTGVSPLVPVAVPTA